MNAKLILGIETSCDDTSVAIYDVSQKKILTHLRFSQEDILRKWGGVVPELAARNHLEKITPLLKEAFDKVKLKPKDIDLISVTTMPGLLGPLLTGLNAAKSLALLYKKPIVAVNHLFAHLEAIHLNQQISYPYLGLLVSGGHSAYMLVKSSKEFELLGSTIDDAAGEAFDKGGKLMGLGYPAGKEIDERAKLGDQSKYEFPIGLKNKPGCDLSYSGLKTSLRMFIENNPEVMQSEQSKNDLCASYQKAIVDALALKLKKAHKILKERKIINLPIVVGGGVACNSALRELLSSQHKDIYFVKPEYCTDNGAMIAHYGSLIQDQAVAFPQCLELDARSRYVDKANLQTRNNE